MAPALDGIREALRALPTLPATFVGRPPRLDEIFFPESHAEVLDPDVSLVIGNRGMGKTFWTAALADTDLRPELAKRYLGVRRIRLDDLDVFLGFADPEGAAGNVSSTDIAKINANIPGELIWRSVLLKSLAPAIGQTLPRNFKDLVDWVCAHPDEQLAIFREADSKAVEKQRRILFLFDQLDRLAADWNRIQELTQGLVKTALAMKSYRNIKIKLFMRPDQAENKQLFRFPDASKILGGSRVLSWRAIDLYGLLFYEILRSADARKPFRDVCKKAGVRSDDLHPRLNIPVALAGDPETQGAVFDIIAGELMGRGTRRGRPYSWIPTHLADGRGEISPRTFLQVLKTAAEWDSPPPKDTAIDFYGIQEGVRRASETRLFELGENYPWVSAALEPLQALVVPCTQKDVTKRWKNAKTIETVSKQYDGSNAPIDLVLANLIGEEDEERVLLKLLQEIGVFEVRENGKINVPDIFRVKAGILRKGGVTPQQRRRL